jgi:hypothetical protein
MLSQIRVGDEFRIAHNNSVSRALLMLDATRSTAPARLISTSGLEYIDDVSVLVMIGTKPAGDASGSKFAASLRDGPRHENIFIAGLSSLSAVIRKSPRLLFLCDAYFRG